MENKIEKAIQLWDAAFYALEAKHPLVFFKFIKQFHDHLENEGLLSDKEARDKIKEQSKIINDETYLYRVMSVTSFLSKNSADGSDSMTQFSMLKKLIDRFLQHTSQDKFDPNTEISTLESDKKIASETFLYCAIQKTQMVLNMGENTKENIDDLIKELSSISHFDEIMEFSKKHCGFYNNADLTREFINYSYKIFIIEHDLSDAKNLGAIPGIEKVIGCEDANSLRQLRDHSQKQYLQWFSNLSTEEKLSVIVIVTEKIHYKPDSPNNSPRRLKAFVQDVINILLNSSSFKITEEMERLPIETLNMIKTVVEQQLAQIPKPQRNSVTSVISYIKGDSQKRKSLQIAKEDLESVINPLPLAQDGKKKT